MNNWRIFAILFFFCVFAVAFSSAGEPISIFVSPDGDDAWSGTTPAPNDAKSDGPFATLTRARDKVREIKTAGGLPEGGVLVVVRGGTYYLDATFELGAEDSGTAVAPIRYAAYPGETVRLSGGKQVKSFAPVNDPAALELINENARGKVLCADLKALGITDFGPADEGGIEIIFKDDPQRISRWPNEGFTKIVDVVEKDGHEIHGIPGSKVGKFIYDGDRPKRWVKEKDAWLQGYWFWDWSEQRQRVDSIDVENHVITLKEPAHTYGYRKGQWYYAFNLLSELDVPGEWQIDRENGVLYFWPPTPIGDGVVVSMLQKIVSIKDASFVTFSGFTLEAARGTAASIDGGDHNEIANCMIHNVGGSGVSVSGLNNGVSGCEICRVGCGGISLNGGDRKTLSPGGLYALNNHIHHYGRVKRMYQAGVGVNGVGQRVAHNLIHSAPHIAIIFGGNDHVFEYNEIHHVCFESNDAGAIYAGRDWTMRGNIIRHNYLHDISGFENRGCVGVYLDDMFASAAIYGNVFYKVTSAAFIGGGRDCTVENNIFVDCKPALHVDARALNWAAYHADEWIKEANEKGTILGIAYKEPPYSEKYPQLPKILDGEPKAPEGNVIARNICVGGRWEDVEGIARKYLEFKDNILDQDPHFVDSANLNFRLKDDSPAFAVGFKQIPIGDIGPYNGDGRNNLAAAKLREDLLALPGVAPADSAKAALSAARAFRDENDFARAEGLFTKALETADQTGENKFDILLETGHMEMLAKNYDAARKAFNAVIDDPDAAPYYRGAARLCVAGGYERKGEMTLAKDAYLAAANAPDAIPHQREEAWQAVREIERLAQCKSARDPMDGRVALPSRRDPALRLFVAPGGSDENPGTIEKPFATFERARAEIAAIKKNGGLPKGGVEVNFRGGDYTLEKGVVLGWESSGEEDAPVTYRAYDNEPARFLGGSRVSNFTNVTDPAILDRLPEEARGHVMQANLKEQGVSYFGTMEPRGFTCNPPASTFELFFDGKPMQLSRWPNEGFLRTGAVSDPGSNKEKRGATFEYSDERPARWTNAKDIWLYGYWFYDWADNSIGLASIDQASHKICTLQTSSYGMREGQPYYVYNLLEEIDAPNEWFLDRDTGILYFYPPSNPAEATIEVSTLNEPLVTLRDSAYVTICGLSFELGEDYGLLARGCSNCLIAGCRVSKIASDGVVIDGGVNDGVFGCDINTLGRGGVTLNGGDRKTLKPSGGFIENCRIHNFSRLDRTYTPAVALSGCGTRVAHNLIYDTPCHAMRIEGNDHLVEFNDVHDVVRESDDQGGIDVFLNPTYRGNIFRYNYWHDIGSGRGCGQAGIRLDDAISGTLIYGNVFRNCSVSQFGAVQIHGGKDNWVDGNIFVDCKYGVSFSQWGPKHWAEFVESDTIKNFMKEVSADKPPYSERYPELAHLAENPDVNNVWRNLAYQTGMLLTRAGDKEILVDNCCAEKDPGFFNATDGDFRLKKDAAAYDRVGIRPIPFDEIGLYDHPLSIASSDKSK